MKALIRRLMTGLLAAAMMFSSMPGMGMLVANAAVDSKVNTVTAKVVDSNGQPVEGVTVSLYDTVLNFEYKKPVTDSEGKASYTFQNYDDSSYTLRIKAGQAVTCDTEYVLVVENGGYISTVNGEAVTEAKDLVFQVAADASAPEITSIEAPASMTKDTSSVDVKIVGSNLPESFRCRLQAKYDDGMGGTATSGSFTTVTANAGGSDTERTVTLSTPYCANPTSWEVTVQIPDYSISKTTTIAVANEPSEPADPEQPSVDSKVLNVVVKDGENNPVEGLELSLSNGTGGYTYTTSIGKTNSEGKLSFDVSADTKLVDTFDLVLADSSKYNLSSAPEIYFDVDDDFNTIISTVNDEEYTGLVELTVEKNPEADQPAAKINTVTAKVVDSNGQPVDGVSVSLYDTVLNFEYKKLVTDSEGKATYTFQSYDDSSYTLRIKAGQAVTCDTEYVLVVENGGYISTVNGEAVTEAKDLVFQVAADASAPEITSIEAPESMTKDTSSVDVKIVGKNLPESFRCRLQAKYDDGMGGTATNGSFTTVTANAGGSDTERTVTLSTPYCVNPSSWEVTVQIPDYSISKTATIAVAAEPAAPAPDKAALDAAITDANSLSSSMYTVSTWYEFNKTLAAAKTVQADSEATQTAIDAAVKNLADAKAALVSNRILNIKVVDENGEPVVLAENELWIEKDSFGEDYYFAETDENGMISLDVQKEIIEDTYTFMLDKEGYELAGETVMTIDTCSSCYDRPSMIGTVNGKEYTGLVTITVKKSDAPAEPNIDLVEVNVDTAERQNQEVTVTVTGTALPEELHYDIWSKTSANVENPAVSDTAVTAEGNSSERTFTITLPDADKFDDVKFWRVRVAIDPEDGYVAKEIAVKEHVHDYVTVPGKEATCTESGLTEGKKCSGCGEVVTEQKVIDALGHHEVVDAAKAPTYFATGLTKGKHCDRCGKVTVKRTTVAKLKLGQAKAPKLKAGKRYITVKYSAVKNATAYQIRYHKKGSKVTKTVTVRGSKAASRKISKLSKKRWYNVKVRAIRTVNGRTAYGNWSVSRNVKVK